MLQGSSSEAQKLIPGTVKATCLFRGCPEPLVIHFQGLGPCFRVSSVPEDRHVPPAEPLGTQTLGRRAQRLQPCLAPHRSLCSVLPLHRGWGCFAPACVCPPQQTDRHRPYHQQDNGSSNDAEATRDHDGHTVLGKAWFRQGRLQGVLWRRAQQLAQPGGHSTPRGCNHPLSFGTQEAI